MVLYKDGKIYLKIVYWGMVGSGKTTILKTLYRISKESKKDVVPVGELQTIENASGATLYFDRGIFQSTKQKEVFYRVYTVGGQKDFTPLRKKIFDKANDQTDAVIFVVDSSTQFLEDNIESLLELKNMAKDRLIKEIPIIVMLNKQDLDDIVDEKVFKVILQNERLWYDPDHELFGQNPIIYKSCALYEKRKNIYRSFYECARRALIGSNNLLYPYIFKPPEPPGEPGVLTQLRIKKSMDKEPEDEMYCQYCGRKLTKEERFSHNCRKKP